MSDITHLLKALEQGDPHAAGQLLPLVYDELRSVAAARLAREQPGQTLDATALVHEAYLRLVAPANDQHWDGRGHFFAAAAEAMRRILVERARHKRSQKRGGGRQRAAIDETNLSAPEQSEQLLALDEALTRLATEDPQAERLVNLRYFAGLSIPDAARTLGISVRTAKRHWAYAKAWLYEQLQPEA